MGKQVSSIDLLPQEARDALNAYLRDPAITQKEATRRVNDLLVELGVKRKLSKSAVNRYSMDMDEVGRQLQESREVAKMWIGELGEDPEGRVGNLTNEIIRTGAFRLSMFVQKGEITDDTAAEFAKLLKDLALTNMRLEKAASLNIEREQEIRKQALEEAAKKVDKTARKAGVTPETIALIHEALGING